MRAGAFQLSLEISRQVLKNPILRVSMMAIVISVIDVLVHGVTPVDIGTTAAATVAAASITLCAPIAKRFAGAIPLRRLYILRGSVALCSYIAAISVLIALHSLLRTFDARFAITPRAVLTGITIVVACAFLVFWIALRPRAQHFAQRTAEFASHHDSISIAALDEMYVPSSRRGAAVAKAASYAAAAFGMTVVAKLPIFGFLFAALELFLIMQFLYSLMSLAYESQRVLRSGTMVGSLTVLSV